MIDIVKQSAQNADFLDKQLGSLCEIQVDVLESVYKDNVAKLVGSRNVNPSHMSQELYGSIEGFKQFCKIRMCSIHEIKGVNCIIPLMNGNKKL